MSTMRYYDPAHLVREVRELLHLQGIDTDRPGDERLAAAGASMLLRGLGVTPAMDGADALTRAMDKPWVETDDQAAAPRAASTS
ncbi:hypothetical protein AB0I81_11345 [Nonomuraea sp. NPDC050404]|uniref:hypothetical protein n=1 Tax=Nonomuraea sp. NPDC050404 TaxID=3155783 RepID=UPI0033C7B7AE